MDRIGIAMYVWPRPPQVWDPGLHKEYMKHDLRPLQPHQVLRSMVFFLSPTNINLSSALPISLFMDLTLVKIWVCENPESNQITCGFCCDCKYLQCTHTRQVMEQRKKGTNEFTQHILTYMQALYTIPQAVLELNRMTSKILWNM